MAWIALISAGVFEMFGVASINQFNQKKNISSFFQLFATFGISFVLLAYAMKSLPMGTAYAIWTGIGASGGALLGMFVYNEPKDWQRIVCILLILSAAVGLKLLT